jgi:ABC-type phosphate transport system substrate-binding protein
MTRLPFLASLGLAAALAAPAVARDQIRMVGSSTVYPIAPAVAAA